MGVSSCGRGRASETCAPASSMSSPREQREEARGWRIGRLGFAVRLASPFSPPRRRTLAPRRSSFRPSMSSRPRRSAAARSTPAKVPGSVWQTGAVDIQSHFRIRQSLRRWPVRRRASLSAMSRATTSSPTSATAASTRRRSRGTGEGLAVYQNGVRMNEAFGDTVNWDLIAANAIDKMTLVAGNPIFGLNALGGALNVTMKNGFTWQGFEADLSRRLVRARAGGAPIRQAGRRLLRLYGASRDQRRRLAGGRRLPDPPFYGDVGYRANGFETHLNLTAAKNTLGASASTPIRASAKRLEQRLYGPANDGQSTRDDRAYRRLRLFEHD